MHVLRAGRARCASRAFLQMHHREAFAPGGSDELESLALLCAAHNRLLAEWEFGVEHMAVARGHFVQTK